MKSPHPLCTRASTTLTVLTMCALLSSCSLLVSKPAPALRTYTLDRDGPAPASGASRVRMDGRVLLVEVPHAAPGYDSAHMVYVRQALTQEAYANSNWADTPARMLAPLLVHRLQEGAQFRAVLLAPSAAKAALRLDTTILRLQQDFLQVPSVVRFTVQVTLMDNTTREVLAWCTVNTVQSTKSEDAAGGAEAAQGAVQQGLTQVVAFLQSEVSALSAKD